MRHGDKLQSQVGVKTQGRCVRHGPLSPECMTGQEGKALGDVSSPALCSQAPHAPLTSLVSTELLPRNRSFQSLDSSFSMAGTTGRKQGKGRVRAHQRPGQTSPLTGQAVYLLVSCGSSPAAPGFPKRLQKLPVSWGLGIHCSLGRHSPARDTELSLPLPRKEAQRGLSTPTLSFLRDPNTLWAVPSHIPGPGSHYLINDTVK